MPWDRGPRVDPPIKLDDCSAPDNNKDLDASVHKHGLLPRLSGSATEFLNGAGLYSTPTGSLPGAHAATHQNGGSDEINVAGLSGLLSDPQTPLPHAASHLSGGSDSIKLDDLATPDDNTDLNASLTRHGLLQKLPGGTVNFLRADGTFASPGGGAPAAHAASHQNGGSDEISVAGLSGLLADGQTPLSHAASHLLGGSDAIKLDDLSTPDDNTDLNASTLRHGLLLKLPGGTTNFLRADGTFAAPPGGASIGGAVTGGTAGSVLFVNPAAVLAENNAAFFWEPTLGQLRLGQNTIAAKFSVQGSVAGTIVSVIRGTTSQTGALMEWQNVTPTTLVRIRSTGIMDFVDGGTRLLFSGTAASVAGNSIVSISRTITNATSGHTHVSITGPITGDSAIGLDVVISYTPISSGGVNESIGLKFSISCVGALAPNTVIGFQGFANNATSGGAGAAIEVIGGRVGISSASATAPIVTAVGLDVCSVGSLIGAVTAFYGIHIVQPGGAGAIVTQRGLYIDAVTRGTTLHAIYSAGGQSYHAGKFGINLVTPVAMVDAVAAATTDAVFRAQGIASQTGNLYEARNSTPTLLWAIKAQGHWLSAQLVAPTIAANANLGTGGTATVTSGSTDTAGEVVLNSGLSPSAGTQATITFNAAFATAPKMVLITGSAAGSGGQGHYVVSVTTTTFSIGFDYAAPFTSTLRYNYHVIE